MTANTSYSWLGSKRLLTRAAMIVNAVFMVTLGVLVLTEPLHIPIAVVFFLSAAAMVGLAILTPFPD